MRVHVGFIDSVHERLRPVKNQLSSSRCGSMLLLILGMVAPPVVACTGITLRATDGAVMFARTMEWGEFDLKSNLVIIPRGHQFSSNIGAGQQGMQWESKYGAVGLDFLGRNQLLDGMNEKGLSVNLFYHPGVADYPNPKPQLHDKTIEALDVCQYLLTTCQAVDEVRTSLQEMTVVGVVDEAIGVAPAMHLICTEPSGKAIVIEFARKRVQIYDAPLGCLTNAPTYDWHLTNLRNYLNLSATALPSKKIEDMDFRPLGAGTGMIGLPGDFTPPSRFVRAVAFSQTARQTDTGKETMYEAFRILDNFDVPLGRGVEKPHSSGMRSSTLWTTAYDTKNLVMYYHTMHNRRVRQLKLKRIDFAKVKEWIRMPLDRKKEQDIEDLTPQP